LYKEEYMTVSWQTYAADRALVRAQRRAKLRLFLSALFGRKAKGDYSSVGSNEKYTIPIEDIDMLDIEGRLVPLPPLPSTLQSVWRQAYEEWERSDSRTDVFFTRLAEGSIILEGGMRELIRLELCREYGETSVIARMKPSRTSLRAIERVEHFVPLSECCKEEAC
jgi:hypothetical protein